MFGITSITTEAVGTVILYINGIFTGFLGNLLALVAGWLGTFLKFQGGYFESIPVVKNSWAIFRDFSNMFFILILVIIAFATIFDLQNYNWKGLMTRFIIAALLINFSLAIGGFIIRVSTNLSNVALNQFSDITANLAAGFGLNKLITGTGAMVTQSGGDVVANAVIGSIVSSIGFMILTTIVLIAFISAFAFAIARVPVLWALLIVSPVAWISYIMPQTKKVWSMWWEWFLCWTFFMPLYLFSLVLGIAILSNRPEIETAINLSGGTNLTANLANFAGFTVQDIFFYILTIIIMVGALAYSMKMACAGSGVVTKFVSDNLTKFAKNSGYGTGVSYNSLKKGLLQKKDEIADTGLGGRWSKLYGGERENRLKEAKVAKILGQKGALSEQEALEAKKNYDKYKSQGLDKDKAGIDALNTQALAGQLNKYEILALRKLRAENGWLAEGPEGEREIEDTIRLAGEFSKYSQEYIEAAKKNGFAETLGSIQQAGSFARRTTIVPLKQAILETMAKNNQIIEEDLIDKTLQIFAAESRSVRDNIEKELQKNIKNITGARSKKDRSNFLTDESGAHSEEVKRLLAQQMADDGEITTYQKYKIAAELFGGENETKSREMLGKIASTKERSVAHADILFRKKLGETEPNTLKANYNPLDPTNVTPQRQQMFIEEVKKKLPKMPAKAVVESDADFWDKDKPTEFETAMWEYIEEKEKAEPTTKGKGGKEKAGGGKRIMQRIQKALQDSPDPDKEIVVNRLMKDLNAKYPAQQAKKTP